MLILWALGTILCMLKTHPSPVQTDPGRKSLTQPHRYPRHCHSMLMRTLPCCLCQQGSKAATSRGPQSSLAIPAIGSLCVPRAFLMSFQKPALRVSWTACLPSGKAGTTGSFNQILLGIENYILPRNNETSTLWGGSR